MSTDGENPASSATGANASSPTGASATGLSTPSAATTPAPQWKPIPARQRRILGVLMEKAKTTPDVYPLSLAALVTGANQKSNRYPLMNLTPEQVEDELAVLRRMGAAAEVQGTGRVPKYRHYGHTWLGVKGAEAAVMIELLLRGHQTAGDLRTRASRFEPIADLSSLQAILNSLMERQLVIALTPPGRGQIFTHNLYLPEELQALRGKIASATDGSDESDDEGSHAPSRSSPASSSTASELAAAREEIAQLRAEVERLRAELDELRS